MRNQGSFNNKKELTDEFEDVTILFADIKGFTEFSDKVVDPKKVLLMLKNLFEAFDQICVKNQVFKLYTIGDCYVVLSFVAAERSNSDQEKIEEAKRGTIVYKQKITMNMCVLTELFDIFLK